jgi:cbb3-type cytochrome oxidase maturation protein
VYTFTPAIFDFNKKQQSLSVLFILIGVSILVAICFLAAFLWSVKSGQYDDDYTPSVRILFDDTKPISSPTNNDSIKLKK